MASLTNLWPWNTHYQRSESVRQYISFGACAEKCPLMLLCSTQVETGQEPQLSSYDSPEIDHSNNWVFQTHYYLLWKRGSFLLGFHINYRTSERDTKKELLKISFKYFPAWESWTQSSWFVDQLISLSIQHQRVGTMTPEHTPGADKKFPSPTCPLSTRTPLHAYLGESSAIHMRTASHTQ